MRALLLIAAAGCTTTSVVSKPPTSAELSSMNESVLNREAELRIDGQEVHGRNLTLGTEAVWTDNQGQRQQVPIEALRSVRFVSHGRGMAEGAAIGLLSGAALGALIGYGSGDDHCPPGGGGGGQLFGSCFGFSAAQKAAFGAIGFGALGLVTGSVIGAFLGHREDVQFSSSR